MLYHGCTTDSPTWLLPQFLLVVEFSLLCPLHWNILLSPPASHVAYLPLSMSSYTARRQEYNFLCVPIYTRFEGYWKSSKPTKFSLMLLIFTNL